MLVNGKRQKTLDISDRGLSYGDGVFETIRLHNGRPVLLEAHLQRLHQGCERLAINYEQQALSDDIALLASEFTDYGILKIIITRGQGGRGYRPAESMQANRILSLHSLPEYPQALSTEGADALLCRQTLAHQRALAGIKHLNRLEQVLASIELQRTDFFEGIMLDAGGHVIEGIRTNIFMGSAGRLMTPALDMCGVAGVFRQFLLDNWQQQIECGSYSLSFLLQADEVFVCNSVLGVIPLRSLTVGTERHIYQPGSFSRAAARVFNELLVV